MVQNIKSKYQNIVRGLKNNPFLSEEEKNELAWMKAAELDTNTAWRKLLGLNLYRVIVVFKRMFFLQKKKHLV
jgi:hypothetical protein